MNTQQDHLANLMTANTVINDDFLNHDLICELSKIVLEAAQAVMEIYDSGDYMEERKLDHSPLTEADLISNQIIVKGLENLETKIHILSEELEGHGLLTNTFWAVDPLDGTKEFLAGNGQFTINVGLIINGTPRIGVVCAPALKTVWAGIVGSQQKSWAGKSQFDAFDSPPDATETWIKLPIAMTVNTASKDTLRVLRSRSHDKGEAPLWLSRIMSGASVSEMGSALKFCLLAEGQADLYARIGPTSVWDTAAGQVIVNAAGGVVVDMERFTELRYQDARSIVNSSFIAYVAERINLDNFINI